MRRLASALVLLVFLRLLIVAPAAQTPTGVIDGVVVDDTGGVVTGASVSLVSDTGGLIKSVPSDGQGGYMFDGLPAGRYALSAARIGHATRFYGQQSPSAERVIIVLDAAGRYRARLRLPRLGVIAGTITDENGQPAGVQVRAVRMETVQGVRTPGQVLTVMADRNGQYRFTDLAPGDYLVSAMGPDGEMRRTSTEAVQQAALAIMQPGQPVAAKPADAASTVSYVTVYYPGVLSRSRATAVTVAPGADQQGINVQLQIVSTARVDGTVLDADNKPLPYANVKLVSLDDGEVWTYGSATPAGYYRLAPVPFGAYRLTMSVASQYSSRPPRSMMPGWWASQDLALGPEPVSHVNMRAEPANAITGTVVFDGASPRPDCTRRPCYLDLVRRSDDGRQGGVMDEAGVVVFLGVTPGSYTIRSGASGPPGWTLASAMLNGRDAMDVAFDVVARQDLSGLVVTFTDRETVLTGSTSVGGGDAPMADAVSIVIFPADRDLWRPGARRVRVARPDTSGRYRVTGLPPGDYLLAVVNNFDADAELDAARLGMLAASASRVTLRRPDAR